MKVAEFQKFVGSVVPFAKAAGSSEKAIAELERALQCLEPFKEKSLAEFNDFLRRADEFDRTGKLAAPPPKASRTAKAPKLTVEAAFQIFSDLYARATDPSLTYADIDAKMKSVEGLTVSQLKELAAKVSVSVSGKTKKAFVDACVLRIKELKSSHERTQFPLGETG
jgi:hypothetical protein